MDLAKVTWEIREAPAYGETLRPETIHWESKHEIEIEVEVHFFNLTKTSRRSEIFRIPHPEPYTEPFRSQSCVGSYL
jgi:hypothetical protein